MIKQEEIHQRIPTNETVTLDGPITNHVTIVSADIVIMRHDRQDEPRTIHFNREMLVRGNTHSDFMLEKKLKIDDTLMALTTSGFISDIEGEVNVGFMSKVDLTGGQGMGVVVKGYNIRYVKSVLIEDKETPVSKLYPIFVSHDPFLSEHGPTKKGYSDGVAFEQATGWLRPDIDVDLLIQTTLPNWLSEGIIDRTDNVSDVQIERLLMASGDVIDAGVGYTVQIVNIKGSPTAEYDIIREGMIIATMRLNLETGVVILNTHKDEPDYCVTGFEVSLLRTNPKRNTPNKEPLVTTKLYPIYDLYNGKMPFNTRYGVIKKFITDDVMVEHDTGWLLPGHKFDLLLMTMAPEWLAKGLVDATDTLGAVNIERLVVGLPGKATEVLELGKDFTVTNITKQGASVMQIALVCSGETLAIAEICPDYGTIRLNTSGVFVRGYEVSVVRSNANRRATGDIDLTKPTDNVLVDVKSGRTLTVQAGNTGWREVDLDTLVKESPNRPPLRKRQMFAIVLRTYAEGTGQDEFLRDLLELFPQQIHGLNLDGFVEVNKPSGGVVRGEYENIRPTFTFEEDADRLKGTVIENWLVTRFNSQDLPLADSTVDLLFIEPNDTMTEVCDAWYMRNGRPCRLRLPTSRRALTDDLSEDQDREIGLALEGQLWRGYTVCEIAGRALDLVNAYTSGPAADSSARTAHQAELRELNDAIIAEIIKRLDGKASDTYQVV